MHRLSAFQWAYILNECRHASEFYKLSQVSERTARGALNIRWEIEEKFKTELHVATTESRDDYRYINVGYNRKWCTMCDHFNDPRYSMFKGVIYAGEIPHSFCAWCFQSAILCNDCYKNLRRPTSCRTCSILFRSRNLLFKHLEEYQHYRDPS